MDKQGILSHLNERQRQAVTSERQRILVLAGAGSGKTKVLVHRIAHLVHQHHIAPGAILAVTFTNKAANEMRQRIGKLLNTPLSGIWIGTFHALSARLLRMNWQTAQLPQDFQIIDARDQLRIIQRLCKEMEIDPHRLPPKNAQGYINRNKENGIRPDDVHSSHLLHEHRLALYRKYSYFCEEQGLVDFAELLLRTYELLSHDSIRDHYHQRFQHILVDEFQDTNEMQLLWLYQLMSEKSSFVAVGDEDQSIYGWRGARLKNILEFNAQFKHAEIIRLEQNYRSTQPILAAANGLIRHNRQRLGKHLWTHHSSNERINFYKAYSALDEAKYIATCVKEWCNNEHPLEECAVLYRTNAQSRILEQAFMRAHIPYRIYGSRRFYEREEIRHALAYLQLIDHPHNNHALRRIINVPRRGIGEVTMDKISAYANEHAVSLWDAIRVSIQQKTLSAHQRQNLQNFMDIIVALKEQSHMSHLHVLVGDMLEKTKLLSFYSEDHGEIRVMRQENLNELVNACRDFCPPKEEGDITLLHSFLDNVALNAGEDQATSQKGVALMTLHTAKGLEFDYVLIAGLEENLLPHYNSIQNGDNSIEEERRLLYVGITRARKKVTCSWARSRNNYGNTQYSVCSRFVSEIPSELFHQVM